MAKKEFKLFSWLVAYYDSNLNKIISYDILKCKENNIKKIRKQCSSKEEFSDKLRIELKYQYWSRSEYELFLSRTDDGRIILTPWVGCKNPDEVAVDITDRTDFDWTGFADKHIRKQEYKNRVKIDVFSQIDYVWQEFIEYVWECEFNKIINEKRKDKK